MQHVCIYHENLYTWLVLHAGVMSIMFLYYSEEQSVRGSEVVAHTTDNSHVIICMFYMQGS